MRRWILLMALALVVAACGGDDAATEETTSGDADVTAPAAESGIEAMTGDLGEYLADADGATLYLFLPDEAGESTCNDECASNWPPLTEALGAGDGVDAALLGAVDRTDGSSQLTYNGWPLYYFAGDNAAGDTNGQGVGENWFLVSTSGDPIQ